MRLAREGSNAKSERNARLPNVMKVCYAKSMIPKSVQRFSDKIMLKQEA
jgi:hypothetical protein